MPNGDRLLLCTYKSDQPCSITFRSPLTPLKKGGKRIKVPLFKGDLGGSNNLCVHRRDRLGERLLV
ncbi:MAG TPA: hypothetical protein DEF48_09685 [Nostoc sp. UBA8866]|nr:hypothetical protein [Nostoc sp. UBA8866]